MINPDMMYECIKARHEDIRNAEAACHASKKVRDEQPNRAKELLNKVATFKRSSLANQQSTADKSRYSSQVG